MIWYELHLTDLLCCNFQSPRNLHLSNIPVTVAPLATHFLPSPLLKNLKTHYHVLRSFPYLPIRGQRSSVHMSHSSNIILTFKKSWCRHSKSVHMSYCSYITKHYSHKRNNHANATKATTYIKPYGKKKPYLKYETTQNERFHKIPRKHFVVCLRQNKMI